MDLTGDERLKHNYHELTDFERIYYLALLRPGWSEDDRFFFEGDRGLIGQMFLAERKALYATILQFRPARCFEVGTFSGGGSTFFFASALREVGAGQLITLESNEVWYLLAAQYYKTYLPELSAHTRFVHGNSAELLAPFLPPEGVDCFFLDGAEDGDQSWREFEFFSRHLRSGTVMMAHDWNSEKMRRVRPAVEADPQWEEVLRLEPPDSVGFVVYVRR